MHAVAVRPVPGLPPYGTGWQPSLGLSGKLRDAIGVPDTQDFSAALASAIAARTSRNCATSGWL